MELTFNVENLSKPWFRALIGIIFIVAGYFCVTSNDVSGITRESCVEAEATLYELRMDSIKGNSKRGAWLIFDDYDASLTVHSSCATDELTDALIALKKGDKLKFLHSDTTIYELWANGKLLLDFDTASKKISENVSLVIYMGYILIPAGVLFILSVPIAALIKKVKKK